MPTARPLQPGLCRLATSVIAALAVITLGGCGPARPARVMQPAFSPAEVTRCVLQLADGDGDGECTMEELALVPGLKFAIADLDSDKNGSLSGQEISNWLETLRRSKVAIETAPVRILQGGEPVPGVLVEIIPEPCMGNTSLAAEGHTNNAGIAMLRIPSLPLGAHFGIYRLKITGKDRSGQPIPAQYSSESSFGLCVPLVGQLPTFDLE